MPQPDGFPHAVAVWLGLAFTFALSLLTAFAFGGFPLSGCLRRSKAAGGEVMRPAALPYVPTIHRRSPTRRDGLSNRHRTHYHRPD